MEAIETTELVEASKEVISYGDKSGAVVLANEKTGMSGKRVMNVGEFKRLKKLRGNAATKAYREYLLGEENKASTGELASQMAQGKMIVTGYKRWEASGKWNVQFMETGKLKTAVVEKAVEPAKPVVIADVFEALSDADKAAFIAQFIGKAA